MINSTNQIGKIFEIFNINKYDQEINTNRLIKILIKIKPKSIWFSKD